MKLIDENAANPELEPMDMHGPVEVSITVFAKKKSGELGRLTFTHPSGLIPTRAELAGYMEAAQQALPGLEAEFPSKPEFVAHLTQRETGKAIPMAGARHYLVASCEIPHSMLVHAIIGSGIPNNNRSLHESGVLGYGDAGGAEWDRVALEKLTDYELEALYREVSNG